jgi:hypothetical protein
MPKKTSKLTKWCKNIMLICGTITSVVGALGSIINLVVGNTKKAVMMEMPAPAPDEAYLDGLGRGGPLTESIPIPEPIDWLSYMPEIFFIGVILLVIAYMIHSNEKGMGRNTGAGGGK